MFSQTILIFSCSNPLRSNAVSRFELGRAVQLINRKGYAKAMKEMEYVLGIPKELSLFN